MIKNDNVARHVEAGGEYTNQYGDKLTAHHQIARKKWRMVYATGRVAGTYHPSELKKGH